MPSINLRNDADLIIKAALASVDPARAVQEALCLKGDQLSVGDENLDLKRYQRIIVVGAGKAGAPMAQAVEAVLGGRIGAGRVVVKDGHDAPTEVIEIMEASHPVPDDRGGGGRAQHRRAGAPGGRAGHPVFVPAIRRGAAPCWWLRPTGCPWPTSSRPPACFWPAGRTSARSTPSAST